ncbi:MAG: phenylalanine--tRNA ligase subunit alpha [Euryarchaeota archaeon]|nr:phenylalanine--tRNA ligase subunit alpha [Euryarchaeota archaeon]
MELSNLEKRVLVALGEIGRENVDVEEIVKKGFTLVEVMNALSWLKVKGLVKIHEKLEVEYCLNRRETLPERLIYDVLKERGEISLSELSDIFPREVVGVGIGHLKKYGVPVKDGRLIFKDVESEIVKREELLKRMEQGCVPEAEVDKEIIKDLLRRRGLVRKREKVKRYVTLTPAATKLLEEGVEIKDELTQLTPELIQSGKWRDYELKRYDVNMFAPAVYGGKMHPLSQIIEKIRRIFVEMGFEEVETDYVFNAFWDMDSLFIPQDHPAREMQDTFYLSKPEKIEIEDKDYMRKVKEMHESGGQISRGWQYHWSESIAEKPLLRTHTTVNSIRYLYKNREPPVRMFSIGRVFRRENLDSTHLPEFTQIEGIYMDKDADFSLLLGILGEFYERMGFPEIRFRPSYFPYTEPSLEIEVLYNGKWLELGGAGIFRPEVLEPLDIKYPVLAWGLGLERLAMITLGLKDIRELYISDIDWLRDAKLL